MTYRWDIEGQEWTEDPELGDGPELDGCEVEVRYYDLPTPIILVGRVVNGADCPDGGVVVEVPERKRGVLAFPTQIRPVGWQDMMVDEDAGIDAWERENPGTGP